MSDYPNTPCKGFFAVINQKATPETVVVKDMIHMDGQFVEYNTDDKKVAYEWLDLEK